MKPIKFILLSCLVLASSSVLALESKITECTFGKNLRIIEVAYPEGTETPCEVRYTKNGETKVLWTARAELNYCEEKAAAFIEKQQGWGWNCLALNTEKQESSESESTKSETLESDSSELDVSDTNSSKTESAESDS